MKQDVSPYTIRHIEEDKKKGYNNCIMIEVQENKREK